MKKLLLGTTVIAAGLIAGTAMAEKGPKVTISGVSDFQAAIVDDDFQGGNDKDIIFRNDNEIHFSIDGKYNGMDYGAVIELEADVGDEQTGSTNADRTYVYLQSDNWGRVEFGSNNAASDTLLVNGASVAKATGGISGDWVEYSNFGFKPNLPMGDYTGNEGYEESNKITYYTPMLGGTGQDDGFQLGVSYTPNTNDIGQDVTGGSAYENVFSVGLKYEGKFDQVGFAVSANGDWGDATSAFITDDMEAWQVGFEVDFEGIQFAASYSDWGDTFGSDISFWTAGLAYEAKEFGASITYLYGEEEEDNIEGDNISIGADYKLAPGITPYAEVSIIDIEDPGAAMIGDLSGAIFIVGTQLTF